MRKPFRDFADFADAALRRVARVTRAGVSGMGSALLPAARSGAPFVRAGEALALRRAALRRRWAPLRPMDRLPDALIVVGLGLMVLWANDLVGAACGPVVRVGTVAPVAGIAPPADDAASAGVSRHLSDARKPIIARVAERPLPVAPTPVSVPAGAEEPVETRPDGAEEAPVLLAGTQVTPTREAAPPEPPARETVTLAGVWGPDATACDARRSARTGMIPMTISRTGAKAGDTSCTFSGLRQTGATFEATAACRRGTERWTSRVRIAIRGDRLVWTSAKGVSTYVRCDRMMIAGR